MGYHYIHNLGHFLQQKYFTQTITTHIVILERAKKSKEQLRMNSHVFEPRFAHRDPWFSLVHQASWGTLRAEVASMLNFFTTPTGLRSFLSGGSTTKELLRHHLQLSCTSWICFPSSYKSKVKVCRENRALKKVILVSHWHPGRGPHQRRSCKKAFSTPKVLIEVACCSTPFQLHVLLRCGWLDIHSW